VRRVKLTESYHTDDADATPLKVEFSRIGVVNVNCTHNAAY